MGNIHPVRNSVWEEEEVEETGEQILPFRMTMSYTTNITISGPFAVMDVNADAAHEIISGAVDRVIQELDGMNLAVEVKQIEEPADASNKEDDETASISSASSYRSAGRGTRPKQIDYERTDPQPGSSMSIGSPGSSASFSMTAAGQRPTIPDPQVVLLDSVSQLSITAAAIMPPNWEKIRRAKTIDEVMSAVIKAMNGSEAFYWAWDDMFSFKTRALTKVAFFRSSADGVPDEAFKIDLKKYFTAGSSMIVKNNWFVDNAPDDLVRHLINLLDTVSDRMRHPDRNGTEEAKFRARILTMLMPTHLIIESKPGRLPDVKLVQVVKRSMQRRHFSVAWRVKCWEAVQRPGSMEFEYTVVAEHDQVVAGMQYTALPGRLNWSFHNVDTAAA